tara:strand:- start:119 stop:574 length:456 start_codon:yes stop_codon:yes gene_type:complete
MNKVKRADMKKGLAMEDTLKPLFETKFGFLNKTKHYHSFDFENNDVLIELKTRNVNWLRYESLMFSMKKIKYLRNNNITKDAYFFWKLNDGLYYWKYNEEELEVMIGGRNDRGISEYEECVYIKNEYINNYNDLAFIPFQYDESSKHKDEQ